MDVRRRVDIEQLLQWAYRDELPKGGSDWSSASGTSPMFRLADLGTRVDDWSHEPGFPIALGPAHQDATAIDLAVMELADDAFDWPTSREFVLGNFAALVDENDPALSKLVIGRCGLVALHARMGTRPHWDRAPVFEPIIGRNGKPMVQFLDDDGRTLIEGRKGRHYGPLARCPLMWLPPPREIAYARLEYVAWHGALLELVERLNNGALRDHVALPPAIAAAPWANG